MSEKSRAAISWTIRNEDGPSFGYNHAKIDCLRCETAGGWTGADSGLHCPYGCGVRLVSIQAEEDERLRQEQKVCAEVRRDDRAAHKAERAARR